LICWASRERRLAELRADSVQRALIDCAGHRSDRCEYTYTSSAFDRIRFSEERRGRASAGLLHCPLTDQAMP